MTPTPSKPDLVALAPCPFCGGEAESDSQRGYRNMTSGKLENAAAIYCTKCSADMTWCYRDTPDVEPDHAMSLLAEQWNTRHLASQPSLYEAGRALRFARDTMETLRVTFSNDTTVQTRQYIPLGIRLNDAIVMADAAISALPADGGEKSSEGGCICQGQHRRGYCTEPGCPYSLSDTTPPAPSVAVKVKALTWRDHRPDSFPEPAWSAETPFGFYHIEEVSASDSPAYVVRLHANHFIADKDSLEEAKAAAQADYETRVRSCISTTSVDDGVVRVLSELRDRRLLNDVDDGLHEEIAESLIKAVRG